MVKGFIASARRWTGFVVGLWHREFHDSRIILEQQGDLRYLVVSARLQRNFVRSSLVIFATTAVLLVGLSSSTVYLRTQTLLLENSHREIFQALQSAGLQGNANGESEYSQEDMLEMARVIRERDMQIRQYIGDWTDRLAFRNDQLRGLVRSSGLNEKVIGIIQSRQSVGGFNGP